MIPVIAIVGRPNVGKSTLFNQLTRSRDALVADIPGLTRDRQYGEARFEGQDFWVIDTGGLSGDEEGIDEAMAEQSLLAVSEADAVLFVVDGRNGVSPGDQEIAARLRVIDKPIWLVVNKTDGIDENIALADFYGLLSLQPLAIAASHGKGVHQLQREFLSHPLFQQESETTDDVESGIKIGIIGRPNVGKSTLVNRMLGEERVVVFDQAGTTRDSIYIPYERHGERYTVIDTAGVRRRGKVDGIVEKFSVVKTMKAINDAHVILLVVDARDNLVEQDLHLLGAALQAGRALVIAVNKWDGMDIEDKEAVKKELERRLEFIPYATTHFISAKHGTGVGNLYKSIHAAYESAGRKLNTHQLTEVLLDAVQDHQPPSVHGRRIKLRYAHPAGNFPPKVIIHGNQVDKLPTAYMRYLENTFRRVLKLKGTPIRIETKTHENPFAGKKNSLSERQEEKRRRHRRFIKTFKR